MTSAKEVQYNEEEVKKMLTNDEEAEFERFYSDMSLTEETTCGFWIFKGKQLQKLANKKVLVLLFGLAGCCFSSTFSYFNGTITTMEKRFKFSSKATGIILIGNDITKLILSIFLNYYASRGHRPRWIAFGLYSVAAFCFLNTLPHLIYGPGSDALHLTLEYASNISYADNSTQSQQNKMLCADKGEEKCELGEGSIIPPIILFLSQLIGGLGGCLYYSLGFSYLDDNIQKTKSPAIISFTYFVRMLGPALGYGIVSICLKIFISPQLTPTINNSDPRWLGAWWLGWLILGGTLIIFTTALCMFPNTLPRALARKEFKKKKSQDIQEVKHEASLKDMMKTLKRLLKNRLYVYIQLSNIFSVFGFNPFWVYLPKYIEVQYKKSASAASLVTGTVGLLFAALGILLGGVLLQKLKPKARYMACWNAIINFTFILGVLSYSLLGCPAADSQIAIFENGELNTDLPCNANCKCDYVKFSPVCSMDKSQTFISACHAGCTQKNSLNNGHIIYSNCSCIQPTNPSLINEWKNVTEGGAATSGPCDVDCELYFNLFLVVVCSLKLTSSMGRVTSFLVSVRCVEERDKTVSLAITMAVMSVFSLIPSPIFFGFIMDSTCLVWGKTCTGKGNCWFYNAALLRTRVTYSAAAFLTCGAFFDILTIKNIKDINIFDDAVEMKPMESAKANTHTQDMKTSIKG